jgi:DMSO/TMAO reductase YedYZ molybdopterin-dependent catalytic subunit
VREEQGSVRNPPGTRMRSAGNLKLTRREMLNISLTAGVIALAGFEGLPTPALSKEVRSDLFREGRCLGVIKFLGEGPIPMETLMDKGLDGRLYTDLSLISPGHPATPTEKFFVRTRASALLEDRKPWVIKASGLLNQPSEISMAQLHRLARPTGLHLMECSGNIRLGHFGMLSVADWTGALVSELLDSLKVDRAATHVLISGFDRYPVTSSTSVPGASWIFTIDQLRSSKAFLATEMNASPLTKDHGAPVRLVVPGWYGCVCIKWVDQITALPEGAATTSQMREFAARTMQLGVPELVKDYRPALVEQAAMPVRVEKWLVQGKIKYRVSGIAWGGSRPVSGLGIRFSSQFYSTDDFTPLENFEQTTNDPWTFWTHAWTPSKPGLYFIQLSVKDASVPSRRLDSGYYVRSVEITEI